MDAVREFEPLAELFRLPTVRPRCHEPMQRKRLLVPQQFPDFDKFLHQKFFVGIDVRTTILNQFLELVQRVPERSFPRVRARDFILAELFMPLCQHFPYVAEGIQVARLFRHRTVEVAQQNLSIEINKFLVTTLRNLSALLTATRFFPCSHGAIL